MNSASGDYLAVPEGEIPAPAIILELYLSGKIFLFEAAFEGRMPDGHPPEKQPQAPQDEGEHAVGQPL
jgi:hypothetical protein